MYPSVLYVFAKQFRFSWTDIENVLTSGAKCLNVLSALKYTFNRVTLFDYVYLSLKLCKSTYINEAVIITMAGLW